MEPGAMKTIALDEEIMIETSPGVFIIVRVEEVTFEREQRYDPSALAVLHRSHARIACTVHAYEAWLV
jgi:hypothetical protein